MKILKAMKTINDFFNKFHDNKPYILDIIPKSKKQFKFVFLLIAVSVISLTIFTLILSLIIK